MKNKISTLTIPLFVSIFISLNCNKPLEEPDTSFIPTSQPAPQLIDVKINNGIIVSESNVVDVQIEALYAEEMMLSINDKEFTSSTWQPFQSSFQHKFPKIGYNTLFVKLKSSSGLSSIASSNVRILGNINEFWVIEGQNPITQKKIKANLIAEGERLIVYAEDNCVDKIVNNHVELAVRDFDEMIYPLVTQYFGDESDVDENGKIITLIYDINIFLGAAGYFFSYDVFEDSVTFPNYNIHSNEADIIYIDSRLLSQIYSTAFFKRTIAHEFQHLCNNNLNYLIQNTVQDVYINEGLSVLSEQIVYGNIDSWVNIYSDDRNGYIKNGYPLIAWFQNNVDYSLSYMFFTYLTQQNDGNYDILTDITFDEDPTTEAVIKAAKSYNIIEKDEGIEELLLNWFIANLLNNESGKYGYNGYISFNSPALNDDLQLELYPGGGLYKSISGSYSSTPTSSNILYAGIDLTSMTVDAEGPPYEGDRLVVYNKDIDPAGTPVTFHLSPQEIISEGIFANPYRKVIETPSPPENCLLPDLPFHIRPPKFNKSNPY